MNWIKIENRQTWLVNIPKYHPDSTQYLNFWKQSKRKCIEGFWGSDFGKFRYMPGPLFFYVNFCRILDVNEETKTRRSITPFLRDLEWELSYMMLEAKGFSGFKEDNEYTSDIRVKEYEQGNFKYKFNLKHQRDRDCFKEDGSLKKYITPRENIRKLHDKPLGPPLYWNNAKNIFVLGARGAGKSYYFGLGEGLHQLVFDGAKYYTDKSINSPDEIHINIGSAESNKSSEICEKIELCMNAFATDDELGVWGDESSDDYSPIPFYKSMSGTLAPNNAKSPWAHKYQQKVNGKWVTKGTKSKLVHSVYKDKPTAAAGGRYTLMIDEEVGLHEDVTITHNSNIACTERGSIKFGVLAYIGTSGDIEKVKDSRKMFTDPESYDIVSYNDDYENTGKIGFFIPAFYANNSFKDENGNTNVEEALEYFLERRKKAKASKDAANYEGELMNYPIKPSEMFLTKKGNILPIGELEEQRSMVIMDRNRHLYYTVGSLIFDSKQERGVKFLPDINKELKPIFDYPTPKNQDTEGALIVYEPPIEDYEAGKIFVPDIYVIGHDPVNSDTQGEGLSLSAFHVFKMPINSKKYGGNELVASYIGRPYMGRDYVNEMIEKVAMWYGNHSRMINFERGGNIKEYFEKKKKLNLLMTQPATVMSYKSQAGSSKTLLYGTPVTSFEQKFEAIKYLRDWLLEERGVSEDNRIIRNLNFIRDTRLLEEMIAFDFEGNFDSVLAFAECIIALKEKYNQFQDDITKVHKQDDILSFLNNSIANRYKKQYNS